MNTVKLVRYFVTIVDEGHFGHAARRLGMTQPPLSQGLRRLEAALGVRLLHRGARGLTLTDAGADLLPHAHRLLQAERDLRDTAAIHTTARAGLRLGVVAQLPASLAAALTAACSTRVPGGGITLRTAPTVAIVDAVTAGRLDLGVITHPAVLGNLVGGDVVRLPTALLLPRSLALPADPRTRLRDLLRVPLATAPRDHAPAAHDLLVDTLREHSVTATPVTVDDERSALALTAAGQVCAVTADDTLRATGVVRLPVPSDVLPLRLRVVWHPTSAGHLPDDLGETVTSTLRAHRARPAAR